MNVKEAVMFLSGSFWPLFEPSSEGSVAKSKLGRLCCSGEMGKKTSTPLYEYAFASNAVDFKSSQMTCFDFGKPVFGSHWRQVCYNLNILTDLPFHFACCMLGATCLAGG